MLSDSSTRAAETESLSAGLAGDWLLVAIRGLAAVAFGLIAFWSPAAMMLAVALLFAAYSLVDGILNIVLGVRGIRVAKGSHQPRARWGWIVANGLLGIAVAILVALWPGLTVLAFVFIFGVWALVSGGLSLAAAMRLNKAHGRWLMALSGVWSVACGLLFCVAPLVGAVVLAWWLGAYSLLFGVALLALAFRLRKQRDYDRAAAVASIPT
ncbi:HdeD family acid-resistance protein [Cognatilysobacter terrigena]|uniref:HdeD family acid-resistance protein n=1 Tax=Cognatilysobacter terrigena TaxID=2488749 RepID=UPI001060BAD9|nr:HdeD family acid-resistance protein [Lysobacter terrigena]